MEKRDDELEELLKPRMLPQKIKKEVKVQESKGGNGKQFSIRLPRDFVEELNIKKGDIFIIEYNPEEKKYSIKLKGK